jgi:hypothetical protein
MYAQAHSQTESSSAKDVQAAMAQLPAQTQQRLAEIMNSSPDRLRDSIAHSMGDPDWSAGERQALWTIGAARKKQAQDGMDLALGGQPTAGGGWSLGGPSSPDATAPPPGTPSLGAPLREQRPTGQQQASEPQEDASDINPFRE